jgi:hypothetical protein
MGTAPAGDDHGRSLLLHPIPIQIEQLSRRIRKTIEAFDKSLEWIDSCLSIDPISNPIDLLNLPCLAFLNLLKEKGKTNFPFSQNDIIDKRTLQNSLRIATDMGSSHHDDFLMVPFLDDLSNLKRFSMVRSEGGRDPENVGLRIFDLLPNLVPTHAKMVITGIELERTSIIEGIEIFKVRKFGRDGN